MPKPIGIDVNGTVVTDAGVAELAKCKSLSTVNLGKTAVTDSGLALLTKITGLESLWLDDTSIGDASVPTIAKLRSLSVIGLERTKLTEQRIAQLKTHYGDAIFGTQIIRRQGYVAPDSLICTGLSGVRFDGR
jgi:hypothetical protein